MHIGSLPAISAADTCVTCIETSPNINITLLIPINFQPLIAGKANTPYNHHANPFENNDLIALVILNEIMTTAPSNIVLIGMPGAGKSTVGVLLASKLYRNFLDTDQVIQESQGRALQDIVNTEGQAALRVIEEEALLSLACHNQVIATGGSAVYSEQGMNYLKSIGIILFLDADQATLEARIHNFSTRGLVRQPGQSFAQLFNERLPLYRKYADIIINSTGQTQEAVFAKIIAELRKNKVI